MAERSLVFPAAEFVRRTGALQARMAEREAELAPVAVEATPLQVAKPAAGDVVASAA